MGMLNYATAMSLDGYIADEHGNFDWAAPTEEIFAVHLARLAHVSTEILGRKTYALMRYWDAESVDEPWTQAERDFARDWPKIDKVVVSTTLSDDQLVTGRERLVRSMSLDDIRQIVHEASDVVEIFGPTTAAEAIRAGLVDRFEFFIVPVMIGGGLAALPSGVRCDVRLTQQRVFENGTVYVRYEAVED